MISTMGSRGSRGFSCRLTLIFVLAAATAHAATYSGGTGIEGDPFLISTVQDLLDLGNPADWEKHFLETSDIDMGGFTPAIAVERMTKYTSDSWYAEFETILATIGP